jgi:hypothetical protein
MYQNFIEEYIDNLRQDRDLRGDSSKWANWMSELLPTSCKYCVEQHGKIFDISILDNKTEVQAHRNCKCIYVAMRTKLVGFVTYLGIEGADAYLADFGFLPEYYISKKQAQKSGWQNWKGNLDEVLPGKMIGGDIYKNKDGKLPQSPGRVWYEADINYEGGYRNSQRILYSSDGLMFVSYDHYKTFYEITE